MQGKFFGGRRDARTVHLHAAGCCTKRRLDAARLARYFELNGCRLVDRASEADHVLVVTCGVTQAREDAFFATLDELAGLCGELIVVGCLPATAPARFARRFGPGDGAHAGRPLRVIPTDRLDEVERLFPEHRVRLAEVEEPGELHPAPFHRQYLRELARQWEPSLDFAERCLNVARQRLLWPLAERLRHGPPSYLRVSDGCVGRCAYCAIRFAIGPLRSRPLEVCVAEYRRRLAEGHRRFELVSDDLGAYGRDLGSSLPELLEALWAADPSPAIRWTLHDLHPWWAVRHLATLRRLLAAGRIGVLVCPVQSGSGRILELMRRQQELGELREALRALRQADRRFTFWTHIMVGFPTETLADVDATLALCAEVGFDTTLLCVYSDREGTEAATLEGKISEEEKRRRGRHVRRFCRRHRIAVYD